MLGLATRGMLFCNSQAMFYQPEGRNDSPVYGYQFFLGNKQIRGDAKPPTFAPRQRAEDGSYGEFTTKELWHWSHLITRNLTRPIHFPIEHYANFKDYVVAGLDYYKTNLKRDGEALPCGQPLLFCSRLWQ